MGHAWPSRRSAPDVWPVPLLACLQGGEVMQHAPQHQAQLKLRGHGISSLQKATG